MNVFFGQKETKLFNEIKFISPQQQQQPRQDTYNDIRPDILEMIKVIIFKNLGCSWRSRWWDLMIIDPGIIMIVMFKMVGFDDHWSWHHHNCDDHQEEQKAKLMEPNKHWGQPPVPNVQGDGYNYQVFYSSLSSILPSSSSPFHHYHCNFGLHPKSHKHFIPYMGFCASIWDSVRHHYHHHHHHHHHQKWRCERTALEQILIRTPPLPLWW